MKTELDKKLTKREFIQFLIDERDMKGFEFINKSTKRNPCSCCYCSECRYDNDECVCQHNYLLEKIMEL